MSCSTLFTGDTITFTGVSPEGSASDTITLPIPDWPTSRKENSSTKIVESLDGDTLVFAGDEYFTRENYETRELVFNLDYTQKETLFTFLKSYTGKRITVTGFIESVGTKFVISSPIIEIEETLKASLFETAIAAATSSGAQTVNVSKLATFNIVTVTSDLRVRFYDSSIPTVDYGVERIVNVDAVTDAIKLLSPLADNLSSTTRAVILNKCPMYRIKISLTRTDQI